MSWGGIKIHLQKSKVRHVRHHVGVATGAARRNDYYTHNEVRMNIIIIIIMDVGDSIIDHSEK